MTHLYTAQVWHMLTRITQFYLQPTRLSTSGMNHTCLFSSAAEHHRTLAGTYFPSHWGRRLSWRGWLGEILRWFIRQTVTHPSTNQAWRRVTSLMRSTTLPLHHAATLGPPNALNVYCSGKISSWRRKMDQTVLCKAVYHKIFDIPFAWIHLRLHLSRPRLRLWVSRPILHLIYQWSSLWLSSSLS